LGAGDVPRGSRHKKKSPNSMVGLDEVSSQYSSTSMMVSTRSVVEASSGVSAPSMWFDPFWK
jgi:hypothetical protein